MKILYKFRILISIDRRRWVWFLSRAATDVSADSSVSVSRKYSAQGWECNLLSAICTFVDFIVYNFLRYPWMSLTCFPRVSVENNGIADKSTFFRHRSFSAGFSKLDQLPCTDVWHMEFISQILFLVLIDNKADCFCSNKEIIIFSLEKKLK